MQENLRHLALLGLMIVQCVILNVAAEVKEGTASFKKDSEDTRDFIGIPPFLKQNTGKPSVILALSTSGTMLHSAYDRKALRQLATGFNPLHGDKNKNGKIDAQGEGYEGYFNPLLQYRYDTKTGIFMAAAKLKRGDNLAWDGSFLNWLTMRRIDLSRKLLVGGKVRQRKGEWLKGAKIWVLEGEVEFNHNDTLDFQDPQSARYSPILNHAHITIEKGRITVAPKDISSHLASVKGFNIHVAVTEEPKGFIQNNRGLVNFGLSVYNFDHKLNTEKEIINNRPVRGQSMHPCYPLFDHKRLAARRSQDKTDTHMKIKSVRLYNGLMRDYLCIPTGVHAQNEKIVHVIEEYPLVWGRTLIAEMMVDIGHYISQQTPDYVSGNDPYGVYGVDRGYQDNGFVWDPYFDSYQGTLLPCKPVFILNFTDGVALAENGNLEKVALAHRGQDCRTGGLDGEQNIVSYYVYAAFDDADPLAVNQLIAAATQGGFSDNNESLCPSSDWNVKANCIPDNFSLVNDIAGGTVSLQSIVRDMLSQAASSQETPFLSTVSNAEGVVYQASFSPSVTVGADTAKWVGDVSAILLDQQGRLRSDNGNGRLDNTKIDPIYSTCYDAYNNTVRVKKSFNEILLPNDVINHECSEANGFVNSLSDIGYLWQANSVLSSLSETEAANQREPYSAASKNRYIRTNIPTLNSNGDVESLVEKDFEPATFTQDIVGLLNTRTEAEAAAVVNYIRGIDQSGMRSRQLNNETQRLGDIIYSSPAVVGAPAENLYLMNGEHSYREFFTQYKQRRTVVYVGANDGMLHAFNGGWYDKQKHAFSAQKLGANEWLLGQEIWGFVPYNLLPHLTYLTQPEYGMKVNDHAYFVDQTPYVFDAQIFGDDGVEGQADTLKGATHPKGWGTVLVVGFRSGGGLSDVYPDPSNTSTSLTLRPAYLVFDITDPEQSPKLLAEFTHEKLGATLSVPTAVTVKNNTGTDWYLAFGSGPATNANGHAQVVSEQNAHLFMFNLKEMNLERSFGDSGLMDLGERHSFVGDLVAADIDLDGSTDVVYFGTVSAIDATRNTTSSHTGHRVRKWGGSVSRLRIKPNGNSNSHQWRAEVMFDAQAPVSNRPNVSFDKNKNRWVHVATGRFYTEGDLNSKTQNWILGLKETRNSSGTFAMDVFSDVPSIIPSDNLVDVSDATVTAESGLLNNTVAVSPALKLDTVEALEARQMQFSQAEPYLSGWKAALSKGEIALGAGAIFGGIYSQTTYQPEQSFCSVSGDSYLYALRYTTGTAWFKHVLEAPSSNAKNIAVIEKVQLGTSPSLSTGLYLGEQRNESEAIIINTNADHSISINSERNLEGIVSKEVGWRQL